MDKRPLPLRHMGRRAAAVFGAFLLAAATSSSAFTSTVSRDQTPLPPGALRGPIERLRQYPTLSLATSEQRAAAVRLLEATRRATRPWRDPRAAAAAGFRMKLAPRLAADTTVRWFHSENYTYLEDDHYFDPQHIETLIYANAPGHPLVLIGVMFALRRGMRGVSPGGPITRWHKHWVCARGKHRGSPRVATARARPGPAEGTGAKSCTSGSRTISAAPTRCTRPNRSCAWPGSYRAAIAVMPVIT